MFKKILVANRGEIAIRIFRACNELAIKTVGIYSFEDRFSLHRYKADESYQVGIEGEPVRSYLNIDEIIRVAKEVKAEAIHPGYGFLSERIELRAACEKNNIVFIGPSSETLDIAGDKVKTKNLADKVRVPTIPGSKELNSVDEVKAFATLVGFPIIIKAAYGGGGRGMRVVHDVNELPSLYHAATSEALSAFGRKEVFAEKYLSNPKHIEVQLIGDGSGEVAHLFERDCSVQRRHQKVVEMAPAVTLTKEQKEKLFNYGLALARELKLKSVSTAEFLVDEKGGIFFIEINPRIQVEHTVTEEITGIDLIQSQIKIAAGETLKSLGLEQEKLSSHGVAIQCRLTTENPEKNFAPDYGKLLTYRSASGFGIRLDAGSAFTGAIITPFYDSLLVKITARGNSIPEAARRLKRALAEFRVRGVNTNIPFLDKLLSNEVFLKGEVKTTFLENFKVEYSHSQRKDRANKLLKFLADVSLNGHESMPNLKRPTKVRKILTPEINKPITPSWKNVFEEQGKEALIKKILTEKKLLVTDTTFRDAHQSLLATRLRTKDILQIAKYIAVYADNLFSLEMWGGATFDVSLRFLKEDPFLRLSRLREVVPNILFQMLLRGDNAVGYTSYPANLIKAFIKESKSAGMDIFRIFDSLNNVDRMRTAIDGVRECGGIAEACLCYTGDVMAEEKKGKDGKFNLKYYLTLAKEIEKAGADILAIKDMAGLLRPYSAELLVKKLKAEIALPIHFHTHDTAGTQIATYLKAAEVGVDIVDCAFSSMSGLTSQPSLEGLVASLANTERDTNLKLEKLFPVSNYFECIREIYSPFESDLKAATAEVYLNEIPGGQYSNFRPQAESLGLGDKWTELKEAYADVNNLLGGIVKVTPSSKVVGDFAIFLVANKLTIGDVLKKASELDFPESVIEFFQGAIGVPFGGFPEPLRTEILRNKKKLENQKLPDANIEEAREICSKLLDREATDRDAISYLFYPKVFKEFATFYGEYGDVSVLPSLEFFYGLEQAKELEIDIEQGKRLYINLKAIGEPNEEGERTLFYELNGQPRNIIILDKKIKPQKVANVLADPQNKKQIPAPLTGVIASIEVKITDNVKKDQPLFILEAMKMQTVVSSPADGKIKRLVLLPGTKVKVGDLVLEME
ncbi:MAG: pyruvate carboxylase [Proteobacteria bacterium]|nr:pyruvate carboxylase [Pseudomonadota bacterium]